MTNDRSKLLLVYAPDLSTRQELDLFLGRAQAGFPSPADDYVECRLDLNDHLIRHPSATFFVRAEGDSMMLAGIHSGDLLIVDKSLSPTAGQVVIAVIEGRFTVKRLKRIAGKLCLAPENDAYDPLPIDEAIDVSIWGVVTHVVHKP